jgi:tetratricopeptide (TPR) repeat protein
MIRNRSQLAHGRIIDVTRALQEAAALHKIGHFREAERRYQIVLDADDGQFDALYRLGLIRLQQGRFGEATKLFRRAIRSNPQSADSHHHLAVALSGSGRHDEAIERYQKALAINPELAEAHNNLGHSLHALGRIADAIVHYERALALKVDYPEARNNLGIAYQSQSRSSDAAVQYELALATRPNYADAHKNLGNLLGGAKRYREAAAHYESVLAARPADAEAHVALGNMLCWLDRPEDAITHYRSAVGGDPKNSEAHIGLGHACYLLGRPDEAVAHYQRALAIRPNDAEAHNRLGETLQAVGRFPEATDAFAKAIDLAPNRTGCFWNLVNSKTIAADDPLFLRMTALGQSEPSLSDDERIDLHFALGRAFGDLRDAPLSLAHFMKGNALKRRQCGYDEATTLGRLMRIKAAFAAESVRDREGLGAPSATPIFIVGMPRSGTTLVEQILASHPKVFGGGEQRAIANLAEGITGTNGSFFPEAMARISGAQLRELGTSYLQTVKRLSPNAERVTDKMPGNFVLLGLIHLTLPNARIIHVRRDIRDTAVSCFSTLFARGHEFTYDLAELGRYCRAYLQLMEHWRQVMPNVMLEIDYEDLVADLESQARRIVAHCDLTWDDGCLDFHRTERSIRTASARQVRQPIYRSSVGRWREHEVALQPLLEALG